MNIERRRGKIEGEDLLVKTFSRGVLDFSHFSLLSSLFVAVFFESNLWKTNGKKEQAGKVGVFTRDGKYPPLPPF